MSFGSSPSANQGRFEASDCIKVLKLGDAEERELVSFLEEEERSSHFRRHPRYRYAKGSGLSIRVYQPGGWISQLIVVPRNISKGGLGFLHGGYVHAGAVCIVKLRRLDGREVIAGGQVVRCCCLCGPVHDIGVSFDRNIEVAEFVEISGAEIAPPEPTAEVQDQAPEE